MAIETKRIQVTATKEVLLSAGVVGTPQILQLSGIGDASALSAVGVTPILDLPDVGAHLTDHPLVANYFQVSSEETWDNVLRDQSVLGANMGQWQTGRQGLFVNSPANTQGYQRLPADSPAFEGISDPASGPNSAHTELIFIVCDDLVFLVYLLRKRQPLGWFRKVRGTPSTYNRKLSYGSHDRGISYFS